MFKKCPCDQGGSKISVPDPTWGGGVSPKGLKKSTFFIFLLPAVLGAGPKIQEGGGVCTKVHHRNTLTLKTPSPLPSVTVGKGGEGEEGGLQG